MRSRILLKARPTAEQLADRLADPRPDGLELYLDTADIANQEAMDGVVARLEACRLPSDFTLLVEGPIRSLDGQFYDLSRDEEADRELARRIVDLARRIGAVGANVHAIAPDADPDSLTLEQRARILRRAERPAGYFAELALAAGLVPTIENMPLVLRMRESGFYFSAIGMPPQDLVELAEAIPGLRVTFDLSHAQLYVNARRGVDERADGHDLSAVRRFVGQAPGVDSIEAYLETLGDLVVACHVANATGLLGEGLPYDEGDLDLDAVMPAISALARYLVTETLESDPNHAVFMRDAQARLRRGKSEE